MELKDKVCAEDSSLQVFCVLVAIESMDMDKIAEEERIG